VKRAILSLLESGRKTGFVFSSGAEATELVPICDGYLLYRGMSSFPHGGETITRQVLKFMEDKAINKLHPYFDYECSFNIDAKKETSLNILTDVSASIRRHFKLKIAREAKEEFVRVLTDTEEK
jgi:actin-related protein